MKLANIPVCKVALRPHNKENWQKATRDLQDLKSLNSALCTRLARLENLIRPHTVYDERSRMSYEDWSSAVLRFSHLKSLHFKRLKELKNNKPVQLFSRKRGLSQSQEAQQEREKFKRQLESLMLSLS